MKQFCNDLVAYRIHVSYRNDHLHHYKANYCISFSNIVLGTLR